MSSHLAPAEPIGLFLEAVARLARSGASGDRAAMLARQYLRAMQDRRRLLAETPAKEAALARLAPAVRAAERAIVFTQCIAGAEGAATVLRSCGVTAASVHSALARDARRSVLARYAAGELRAVTAPLVLDEGVDVPAADLGIILAASRSRRQMVQRMGRVLRRKPDGRPARFAVVFVEGTTEDPAHGAHGAFLDEVTGVADRVVTFPTAASADEVSSYLVELALRPRRRHRATPHMFLCLVIVTVDVSYGACSFGGRATSEQITGPNQLDRLDPADRALVYGVVGGMPMYLSWWDQDAGIDENLARLVCEPGGRLLSEGDLVLRTDIDGGEYAHQILHAIATGRTQYGAIKEYVKAEPQRTLERLAELRLITRDMPVGDSERSKRRIYRILDPFVRFHLGSAARYRTEIERGLGPRSSPSFERRSMTTWAMSGRRPSGPNYAAAPPTVPSRSMVMSSPSAPGGTTPARTRSMLWSSRAAPPSPLWPARPNGR